MWGPHTLVPGRVPQLTSHSADSEVSQPPRAEAPLGRATLLTPSPGGLPACPRPGLPWQVLGCGTGNAMVLGATWADSGLCADSSAASGLGGPPSVTGRAKKRGGLMSIVNLRPFQVSLGALKWGWLISHTHPAPPIPRQRKQRLREEHISGKIHLAVNQSRGQGGERVSRLR